MMGTESTNEACTAALKNMEDLVDRMGRDEREMDSEIKEL